MTVVLDGNDNFNSGQPFVSSRYISSAQTITTGGLITLTHGLTDRDGNPVKPFHVSGYLKCLVAEHGYSVDDEVEVSLIANSASTVSVSNSVKSNDSQIVIRFSNETVCFIVNDFSTGGLQGLTNANWQLYIRAWA